MTKHQLFINNGWVDPASGQWFDALDSFFGEAWAQIPQGNAADVNRAARAAAAAMGARGASCRRPSAA